MTEMNCVHGIDARFCAACNKTTQSSGGGAIGRTTLDEVLIFLNHEQIRATYAAVADVVGVVPRALSGQLGPRRAEASWVVSAETGLPTDDNQTEWHPALLSRGEIIKSGRELLLRLTIHRGKPSAI
jgi:hypothetical protein